MRIIAGKYRGRPLISPKGVSIRPTPDRARQALFNIIGARIEGAAFLDLFAGSGAVGLEALSRGAAQVTAVESHPETVMRNMDNLGAARDGGYLLTRGDVFKTADKLRSTGQRFDLIFADPPWAAGLEERIIEAAAPLLADDGALILEMSRRTTPPEGLKHGLRLIQTRRYGEAVFSFYQLRDRGEERA